MNISNDNRYCNRSIHLKRSIFSVNLSGASLCLQSRLHPGYKHSRTCYLVVLARDFKTSKFCLNYTAKYEIVKEYRYTAIQNSTHFIWMKHHKNVYWMLYPRTIQKYLIATLDHSFTYHRPLFTAKLRDGQLSNKIQYICEFKGLRNQHYWYGFFYMDRQYCKWDQATNINK